MSITPIYGFAFARPIVKVSGGIASDFQVAVLLEVAGSSLHAGLNNVHCFYKHQLTMRTSSNHSEGWPMALAVPAGQEANGHLVQSVFQVQRRLLLLGEF